MSDSARDRDSADRPRNARPRDGLGRPLPYGAVGVQRQAEGTVRTPEQTLDEAGRLLAAGMPFHAHEVFEDAWKSAAEPDRELWRGLAQLAVGITHAARGNRRGALALLRRGAVTITPFAQAHEVDVPVLLSWVDAALEQVTRECPVVLPVPPLARRLL
jgi:hypothetical protein